jgi:hypothetical protein
MTDPRQILIRHPIAPGAPASERPASERVGVLSDPYSRGSLTGEHPLVEHLDALAALAVLA